MATKLHQRKKTPQARVSYILRRCALELHHLGELTLLADEMGVSLNTVTRWAKVGRMPGTKARWLERRFGSDIAPHDQLIDRR
jgi:hypothetical protein